MPTVASSAEIDAPPRLIWSLLCDPHRYPELADPTDQMLSVPDEPMAVGYVYREYGGIPPFKGESTWKVTEFEPHTRQVHIGDDGSVRMDLEVDLVPTPSGTRYTQTLSMKPRWYMRPLNALLWPLMLRAKAQLAMERTVANMKRMAEAEVAASTRVRPGG